MKIHLKHVVEMYMAKNIYHKMTFVSVKPKKKFNKILKIYQFVIYQVALIFKMLQPKVRK